jgi:hypothetical protein
MMLPAKTGQQPQQNAVELDGQNSGSMEIMSLLNW